MDWVNDLKRFLDFKSDYNKLEVGICIEGLFWYGVGLFFRNNNELKLKLRGKFFYYD